MWLWAGAGGFGQERKSKERVLPKDNTKCFLALNANAQQFLNKGNGCQSFVGFRAFSVDTIEATS